MLKVENWQVVGDEKDASRSHFNAVLSPTRRNMGIDPFGIFAVLPPPLSGQER